MKKVQVKTKSRAQLEFDLAKFQDLSDDEIAQRFNKEALPAIIKKLRQGSKRASADCPVCTPWSYSFF